MSATIPAILWFVVLSGALVVLALGGVLYALDGKRDATATHICCQCGVIVTKGGPEISHGLCRACRETMIGLVHLEHQQRHGSPEPRRGGTIVAQGKRGAALGNATTINHSLSPSRGEGKGEESLSDYLTTPNPTI
ncbi:MAG TPA: hypothetical protein VEH27_14890 [Methylomirabilota bacterium]|nr:hypothetical protein [Methylomirabilota bacterium]